MAQVENKSKKYRYLRDMAAQNKLFQRLIWLADTVYSAKWLPADEEIIEKLKSKSLKPDFTI